MKYVMYIDYLAEARSGLGIEYIDLTAKTLEEAIEQADGIAYDRRDEIYLVRIMEKVGKTVKDQKTASETYKAILCKRTIWQRNIKENGEFSHRAVRNWLVNNKSCVWWDTIRGE